MPLSHYPNAVPWKTVREISACCVDSLTGIFFAVLAKTSWFCREMFADFWPAGAAQNRALAINQALNLLSIQCLLHLGGHM